MDRRELLIGALALAGGAVSKPLRAHHRLLRASDSGARLLISNRVASRSSHAYARGLTVGVSIQLAHAQSHGDDALLRVLGAGLSPADRRQLARNLEYLAEHLEDELGWQGARHVCSHWQHSRAVFEARAHLDTCRSCSQTWRILVRGTEITFIPLIITDEVTVLARPQGADPKRELHLPELPSSFRPALAGKELRMKVCVDRRGVASVTRVDGAGISDFVVRRAVEQVEGTPWAAASNAGGRPREDTVQVVFRWES